LLLRLDRQESFMHFDLEDQLRASIPHMSLPIGAERWDLYVFGVTRVHRDWFVQLAAVGPRSCTATVRVTSDGDRVRAAKQVLELVRVWLLDEDADGHAFLEEGLPGAASHAASAVN
jgi:hypothetical protein